MVTIVDHFTYLGVQISNDSNSEQEVRWPIAMIRDCFQSLQNNIRRSSIRLEMKICLLNVYVLPVLLYGVKTWSLICVLEKKLDACHQWCLRRLLCISHLQRVTNTEVLRRINQTQLSPVLCDRRLRLFGHVARSDTGMDHSRALRAAISGLPSHWRRPPGWLRESWTRTVQKDMSALSIDLHTAWLIEQGLTSHQTHYRSYRGRFLQVIWPNQQCQSTEGSQLVFQIRLESHQDHFTMLQ